MSEPFDYRRYPILFVDDEVPLLETLQLNYDRDFSVRIASGGREALQVIAREDVAVLVADQRMPDMTGLELIKHALDVRPYLVPIILTGYTDIETLVQAINVGRIHRYIPKPFDSRELRLALEGAVETAHLTQENDRLARENCRLVEELRRANERLSCENGYFKRREAQASGFANLLGRSEAIQRVIELARRVVDTPTTVLLEGPTGTGKEIVARAIHHEGRRRDNLFVAQNCGAMSETLLASELFGHRRGSFTGAVTDKKGLFEIADGGTLFLDEIAETSPALQVHLLRALQEGEIRPLGATHPVRVDVRVIAATNRELATEVAKGRFREDLFFRLNVFRIRLPALRERREDIPILASHFVEKHSRRLGRHVTGIAPDTLDSLTRLDFPGNVRELEHMVERAIVLCNPGDAIDDTALFDGGFESPASATDGSSPSLQDEVSRFERERIALALDRNGGNRTHAARELGLTYRGLLKKMQRCGLLAVTRSTA